LVTIIITAAGEGKRFGGDLPKQFVKMENGLSVLENCINAAQRCAEIDEIIVTLPQGTRCDFALDIKQIEGAATRAESIKNALAGVSESAEIVLIHDGVRPFVSQKLIGEVIAAARLHGAAVPALRVTDTLKAADANGFVTATVDRENLYTVQTPQGFKREIIMAAYEKAYGAAAFSDGAAEFTDDAAIVQACGGAVFLLEGERSNIKITTKEDLYFSNMRGGE
jgi:2-C-methyl-D-erythritol 4-phosphate cytidylyltransferase